MILDVLLENKKSDKVAIVYKDIKITYKQLYCTVAHNKQYLQDNIIKEEKIYLLQADNQLQFIITFLSLIACSAWVIPINKAENEISKIINTTNAYYLTKEQIEKCSIVRNSSNYELNTIDGECCGVYHISSGSTGVPKLCRRSMQCFHYESMSFSKLFEYKKDDKILSLCPLEHSFAFGAAFINALENKVPLFVIDKFRPHHCLKYINENQISILLLVPSMVRIFCMPSIVKKNYDISCLRIPLVGAGPITPEIYEQFLVNYGVKLKSNFGSSETGCILSRIEDKKIFSVGRPMHLVKIKVCNEEGKRIYNQEGQLYVKSPGMSLSYFNGKLNTDAEGYFITNDLVIEDSEGYIYVKGRKDRIINIGGKKINPREVEESIMNIPEVKDCIVFSKKTSSGEEIMEAYVEGNNVSQLMVLENLKQTLSTYKIPSIINIVPQIKRNSLGKIKIDDLK